MSLNPVVDHIPTPPGYPEQKIADRTYLKLAPVILSVVGLILMIVVSMGLTRAFELALSQGKETTHANSIDEGIQLPSHVGPFVNNQVVIRKNYEKQQLELQTHYHWNNEEQTSVRIPIESAMKKVVDHYKAK